MGAWVDQVHRRAALVHDQIAAALKVARSVDVDVNQLIAPYQTLLEKLYLEELPYARLLEESDLVINAEGPATLTHEPRVSALTHLLDLLRDESRKLARAVGGITEDSRVDNMDLLLSGLARGSLIIGLKLAPPVRDERQVSFLTEDEPVFQAVRIAIRALSRIPHMLTQQGVSDDIVGILPDPAVRDAALITAQRISPSGRSGIDRVELTSPGSQAGVLTVDERNILRQAIAKPSLRQPARGTFQGTIRELDLDAKRVEIRNVPTIGTIRCIIEQLDVANARRWINKTVKVSGQYERDSGGRPRLLRAERITVVRSPRQLRLPALRGRGGGH